MLPAFYVGLSLLFLLASMWEAKKDEVPLWEGGNTLATLFHGLDPALKGKGSNTRLIRVRWARKWMG